MSNERSQSVERFSLGWRLQHILLALSVTGLALTGLAYRYYATPFGKFLLTIEGGFGSRGVLHRVFAGMLAAAAAWHIFRIVFTRTGHEDFMQSMPEPGDGRRWIEALKAKFAGKPYDAEWGRYTLGQKVQYWAVATGTLLMLGTGAILLTGDNAVAAMPKWIVDMLRVAHGGEGVELMIFIVLWHLYSTHLSPGRFPMDRSWLTGRISKENLKTYHLREYRRLFPEDRE